MLSEYTKPVRIVLLAAGQGKRMCSTRAKVLHEVLGKPILARLLEAIDSLNIEHVHVVIGHAREQILEYLAEKPPKTPYSCHVQEPQLGTGHALMQVSPSLQSFKGDLLVSVADPPLLEAKSLASLIECHQKEQAAFSLLTTEVDDPRSYGRIVRNNKGEIQAIVEDKDASLEQKDIKEINPAIYCLEWPLLAAGLNELKNDNKQKEYYLTDLLAWSKEQGYKLASYTVLDWKEVSGVNNRLELAEAERMMRDRVIKRLALDAGVSIMDLQNTWIAPEVKIGQETTILPGCYITGDVEIGNNCLIGPNAQITGPCKIGNFSQIIQSQISRSNIGNNCRIGPFAHLRDFAQISDTCRIGNFVEIKTSDIDSQTNISHLSYIGDACLGHSVNIGAGTITANYDRLSGKKSKTIIGNNSSTGSNSVLVAPVKIGDESMVAAGTVVTKDIPSGSLGVGRARQENKTNWVSDRKQKIERQKAVSACEK